MILMEKQINQSRKKIFIPSCLDYVYKEKNRNAKYFGKERKEQIMCNYILLFNSEIFVNPRIIFVGYAWSTSIFIQNSMMMSLIACSLVNLGLLLNIIVSTYLHPSWEDKELTAYVNFLPNWSICYGSENTNGYTNT